MTQRNLIALNRSNSNQIALAFVRSNIDHDINDNENKNVNSIVNDKAIANVKHGDMNQDDDNNKHIIPQIDVNKQMAADIAATHVSGAITMVDAVTPEKHVATSPTTPALSQDGIALNWEGNNLHQLINVQDDIDNYNHQSTHDRKDSWSVSTNLVINSIKDGNSHHQYNKTVDATLEGN